MDIEMLLVQKNNEGASVNYINLSIKVGWFWKHSHITLKQSDHPQHTLYKCIYWNFVIDMGVCEQLLVSRLLKWFYCVFSVQNDFGPSGNCISVVIFLYCEITSMHFCQDVATIIWTVWTKQNQLSPLLMSFCGLVLPHEHLQSTKCCVNRTGIWWFMRSWLL
jgi:hypothetical protein